MVLQNLIFQLENNQNQNQILHHTLSFAETLIKHAEQDTKIVGITGAMPRELALIYLRKNFPIEHLMSVSQNNML